MTDPRIVAYMLATVQHECASTWQPIEERGGGDSPQDEYRYRGRGYVPLRGRGNYRNLSKALGAYGDFSLEVNPDLVCNPEIALHVMIVGMTQGLFTGRRLAEYITAHTCDYVQARHVVASGADHAVRIAGYATAFEHLLMAVSSVD